MQPTISHSIIGIKYGKFGNKWILARRELRLDLETIFFKGLEFELLTKANYIRYIDQINKFGVGNDFAMSDYLQNDAYFNYITFKESVVLVFEDGIILVMLQESLTYDILLYTQLVKKNTGTWKEDFFH